MVVEQVNADGSRTEIKSKLLDLSAHDDFEQGDMQTYTIELPKPVKLSQLEIRLKKTPAYDFAPGITDDWVCENIRVTPMYAGYELTAPIDLGGVSIAGIVQDYPLRMSFQDALKVREDSANKKSQKAQLVTNLKVEIKVEDEQDAGTDSDIYLKAVFGSTYWKTVLLDKGEGHDDLERGKTEIYNIPITNTATGTAMGIPLGQLYVEFRHDGTDEANWEEVKVTPCYGSLELTTPISLGGAKFQERTWTRNLQTALKKAAYREEPTLSQTATSLDIQINVANELGAGTDDDINLYIYSNDSATWVQKEELDKGAGYNDFEQSDSDVYTVVLNKAAAKIPLDQMRLVFERKRLLPKTDKDGDPNLIHYEDEANWDEVLVTAYNGSQKLTDSISVGGTEFDDDRWDTDFAPHLKLHYMPVAFEYKTNIDGGLLAYMDSLDGGEEWVDDQNELWKNTKIREKVFLQIFKGFAPEIEFDGPITVSQGQGLSLDLTFTGMWNGVSMERRSQVNDFEYDPAVEGTVEISILNESGSVVCTANDIPVEDNFASLQNYTSNKLEPGTYDLKVAYTPDSKNPMYSATEEVFQKAIVVTQSEPLSITKQPSNVNVKLGKAATLTVEVSGGKAPYTYTWQNNGTRWKNIMKSSQYSGLDTNTLTFTPNTAGTTEIRCIIKDSAGNEVTTNVALVNAIAEPLVLKQPSNANIDLGDSAFLTVEASGGTAPYTYSWQVSIGSRWSPISNNAQYSGQGTTTLTFTPSTAGTTEFRCVVTDSAGQEITSTTVKITAKEVAPLVIQSQPQGVTVVPGETAPLTVAVSGGKAPYTYTWQILDGNDWKTFRNSNQYSGQGNPTLYVTSAKEETIAFRCVIRDAAGKEILSDSATVIVKNETKPLTITNQPSSATTDAGKTMSFTVGVSGGKAPYTYTWQLDGGNGWYDAMNSNEYAGQGTNVLRYTSIYESTNRVRCVITDSLGNSVTSDAATATVIAPTPIEIFDQPNDVTGPKGMPVSVEVTVVGGVEPLTYKWQGSNDGNNWVNLNNGDPGIEVSDTGFNIWIDTEQVNCHKYMRCVISDAAGQSVTSRVVTITIQEKFKVQINNGETEFTISYNLNETKLLTANVTGGKGPYTYKWYVKRSDSGKWIEWATTSSYEAPARNTGNGWSFKVEVRDSTSMKRESQVVKIIVPDEQVIN